MNRTLDRHSLKVAARRAALPALVVLAVSIGVTAPSAWAGQAIIFDSASAAASSGATSSFTFTHTIGSGSNYLLVVSFAHNGDSYAVASVRARLSGTSTWRYMMADTAASAPDELGFSAVYHRTTSITSGTWEIELNFYYPVNVAARAFSFFGVNQSTPSSAGAKDNRTSSSPAVVVTRDQGLLDGHVVVDALFVNGTVSGVAATSGQLTPLATTTGSTIDDTQLGSSYKPGQGQQTTMSWALGSSAGWALAAAAFQPPTETLATYFDAHATRSKSGVLVRWRTSFEHDNLGFRVYRESLTGDRQLLTPSLIAGSALFVGPATPLARGRDYAFLDTTGDPDGATYWIEDVDLQGVRHLHGPLIVEEVDTGMSAPAATVGQVAIGRSSPIVELSPLLSQMGASSRSVSAAGAKASRTMRNVVKRKEDSPEVKKQWTLAAEDAVKIGVRTTGWYRVPASEILATGALQGVDPDRLQLFTGGSQVSLRINGADDGSFDPGDSIEFFGTGIDTAETDTRVYWLVAGDDAGKRIHTQDAGASPSGPTSYLCQIERQDRSLYFAAYLGEDRDNFFGQTVTSDGAAETIDADAVAPSGGTLPSLDVTLQGMTSGTHAVAAAINGTLLGTLTFKDQQTGSASFPVPVSALRDGDNTVSFTSQASGDVSLVDTVRLSYSRAYEAIDGVLFCSAPAGRAVTAKGFATNTVRAFDISDPANVEELTGATTPDGIIGYTMTVAPAPKASADTRSLLLLDPGRALEPSFVERNQPSDWHATGNQADLVIVTAREFHSALTDLAALRESEGYRTQIVDVEDAYDEFSFGIRDPQAIKDLLSRATKLWQHPARYVLLVGDGTLDPRGYISQDQPTFMPVKLVPTGPLKTPSDDWFVDFDNSGLPDVPIGRLPVDSAADTQAVVSKLRAYAEADPADSWLHKSVFVADEYDPKMQKFHFDQGAVELARTLSPEFTSSQIDLDQVGRDQGRTALLDAINAGTGLLSYVGHSSISFWAGQNFFTSDDAKALTNGTRLPVLVDFTCFTGFFANFPGQSLGESLLDAPNGGVVAAIVPSSITDPAGQVELGQALLPALTAEPRPTIGDALLAAKPLSQDYGVRKGWLLLGDPTLKLK